MFTDKTTCLDFSKVFWTTDLRHVIKDAQRRTNSINSNKKIIKIERVCQSSDPWATIWNDRKFRGTRIKGTNKQGEEHQEIDTYPHSDNSPRKSIDTKQHFSLISFTSSVSSTTLTELPWQKEKKIEKDLKIETRRNMSKGPGNPRPKDQEGTELPNVKRDTLRRISILTFWKIEAQNTFQKERIESNISFRELRYMQKRTPKKTRQHKNHKEVETFNTCTYIHTDGKWALSVDLLTTFHRRWL